MNLKAMETDTEFEDGTITEVDAGTDGWEIHWRRVDETGRGALCFWCPNTDARIVPVVGSHVRFYGAGLGSVVRGLVVDGKPVFYRTADEQRAKSEQEHIDRENKQRAEYEAIKDELAAKVAAMPKVFRDRIAGFHERNPDFGWRFESYEVFACEQGLAIATALKSTDAIRSWYDIPFAEQKPIVPELSDGHSGNTFGQAAQLASIYLDKPHLIPEMHGALCPLVGCAEYGCWATLAEPVAA